LAGEHDANPANTGDWIGEISEISEIRVNLWLKVLFATD